MKSCLSLDDITADPGLLSPWLQSFLSESVLERLDPLARRGAARLAAWAGDRDHIGEQGLPTVPDLLQFLTSPYRRASPPSGLN